MVHNVHVSWSRKRSGIEFGKLARRNFSDHKELSIFWESVSEIIWRKISPLEKKKLMKSLNAIKVLSADKMYRQRSAFWVFWESQLKDSKYLYIIHNQKYRRNNLLILNLNFTCFLHTLLNDLFLRIKQIRFERFDSI